MTDTQLMLPGLDPSPPGRAGALELAVRKTMEALAESDLIAPRDAARLALAVEMARVIEDKRRSGKMSTIGNDARVLMDLLTALVPVATEVDASLQAAMDEWTQAIEGLASVR